MSRSALHIDDVTMATACIEYEIATTRDEREAAFRLVYNAYLRAGLGEPNRFRMRVTPFHLLPATSIFIARYQGEVIATVSLVADGELGLPMESVYRTEVTELREQGVRLGEISCLADRRRDFRRGIPVFIGLCRLMIQTARKMGLEETLVAVHPKHEGFYRRFCAFEQLGQQTVYPTVRGNPAVAMSLNFERLDRQGHNNYERFFGQPIPDQQLRPAVMTQKECEVFRPMVDPSFCIAPLAPTDPQTPPDVASLGEGIAANSA